MKKVLFSLLMLLFVGVAHAQESQTEYNSLRLPVSAHAAALGGDNITIVEDDPALMFQNPALLSSVSDKSLGLNFMTYMAGSRTASASFSRVAGDKASWGLTGQYFDYGKMKEVDADNRQTGEFSAKDIALTGLFAYSLADHLVGGISARFITSYLADYNSIAMGVDLGLNYYNPNNELSLSVVARNLGGQLKAYDDQYEPMPLDIQLGISKRLVGSPLRLSAALVDMNHLNYKFLRHLVVGADLILSQTIWVGAGYNFRRAHEMEINSGDDESSSHGAGLSFGAGLQLDRFKLNLAYGKYHVSSSSIIINLALSI